MIKHRIIDLDKGELIPALTDYQAVIVLGGPDSANDKSEKMRLELKRIKQALQHDIPYLGICLGMQTLVKAAGGRVVKSPVKEAGLRDPEGNQFTIQLSGAGYKDPLFEKLPETLPVFHLHGETVELAEDMRLLATGEYCNNQAVRVREHFYGIQCHLELTFKMLQVWLDEDPDLATVDKKTLEKDFARIEQEYVRNGKQLIRNFLGIAGL